MMIQTIVGGMNPNSSILPQVQVPQRSGQLGDVILSELQPKYYEQGYRGNIYNVAMQSPTYLSDQVNVIYNGLCLSNPLTSGVNVALLKAGYAFVDVPAQSASIGLMVGYSTVMNNVYTTTIAGNPVIYGSNTQAFAVVNTTCQPLNSIPTPVYIFSQVGNGAISNQMIYGSALVNLDGSIILAPGAYVAFYSTMTTNTNAFIGSFVWEEIPF